MNVDYRAIGRRIHDRRKEVRKTQDELAETVNVSVGYISQIERGVTKPNLEMLCHIATSLDCDVIAFISGLETRKEADLNEELQLFYQRMNGKQRRMLLAIAEIIANS
ncbi:MAG: helix-turn-helix transcriptional regulator [Eubacteriales bacterium]|nr:helix-turn-helix transcriptional regulator [Eubacteriales bacterium]